MRSRISQGIVTVELIASFPTRLHFTRRRRAPQRVITAAAARAIQRTGNLCPLETNRGLTPPARRGKFGPITRKPWPAQHETALNGRVLPFEVKAAAPAAG